MTKTNKKYNTPSQTLQLAEWHIYGSSRVGIYKANKPLAVVEDETITAVEYQTRIKYRYNGKKQYELTNHLGNVLVTISDRRTAICNEVDSTLSYKAVVVTATDYYSFGSPMIGRSYEGDTSLKYRYGFNGKENDNQIKGNGNSIAFEARIYDSRLGRFLSVDPRHKEYPFGSPYSFAGNNPIRFTDVDGEGPGDPMHHQFLTTVAIDVYDAAKAKGASTKGALLVLAQASLESGWGQSAIKYKDFNLFGVMGSPSKRKTSHGSVKDYSNSGGYAGALADYFNKIDKTWPEYKDVIKKENFTSTDIDDALNTGASYPTDAERMKGNYAYNADLDAEGKNHYGTTLFKQMDIVKTRLIKSIDYQIEQNNNQIKQIDSSLSTVGVLTEQGRADLTKQKETLTNQNAKLTTVKTELNAVQ